eukprot:8266367-Alexandrium_andersonii.AAC.1
MSAPRPRWQGTPQELAQAIASVAPKRSCLVYDETATMQKCKTDPQLIRDAHPLLSALHSLHEPLSFNKNAIREAVLLLVNERAGDVAWAVAPQDAEDYLETICRRIVNICRAIRQEIKKHSSCAWVRQLP